MNILMVASECYPFAKTGGLADVISALPKALKTQNVNVSVVLPLYKTIKQNYKTTFMAYDYVDLGFKHVYVGLHHLKQNDIDYYFIDNEEYFNLDNLYGYVNDGERFTYFNFAILKILPKISNEIDIIHLNDWQTGLIPYLLKTKYTNLNIKTIFSIHNIQYQGIFPKSLSFIMDCPYSDVLEFDNNINFMKTAIMSSDIITTVSPTYKEEVLTDYYGYRLNNVLKYRYDDFYGILNGIDDIIYNPKTDSLIAKNYSDKAFIKARQFNKNNLQEYFNLEKNNNILFGLVSRLVDQKGIDILKDAILEVIAYSDAQFIFVGNGNSNYENFFRYLHEQYPSRVACYIGYNEEIAQKVYSSCDVFLMPSKFEPCGLSQLIAMRYGTLPLVRETGGLKDTVIPYNKYTNRGTGFSFRNYDAYDLKECMFKPILLYKEKNIWKNLVQQAMKQDFSWNASSKEYIKLYKKLLSK